MYCVEMNKDTEIDCARLSTLLERLKQPSSLEMTESSKTDSIDIWTLANDEEQGCEVLLITIQLRPP